MNGQSLRHVLNVPGLLPLAVSGFAEREVYDATSLSELAHCSLADASLTIDVLLDEGLLIDRDAEGYLLCDYPTPLIDALEREDQAAIESYFKEAYKL